MKPAAPPPGALGFWPGCALRFALFACLGWYLYRSALSGPSVSDDFGYLVANPYTDALSFENLRAIFDPTGPVKYYTANYAPLHLLLTALERHLFAERFAAYHLVNVLLHAGSATLLVAWLERMGVWPRAALLGGLIFLVHPANVEAVAWISQLKSCAALALALGALLAWPRAPGSATALFILALLTKASAGFALPAVAALTWLRRRRGLGHPGELRWLLVWLVSSIAIGLPQLQATTRIGVVELSAFQDGWVQLRSMAAIAVRYLVMAASGVGVSAFQEPAPALSWLDPWWLAALPLCAVIGARVWWTLRRGSDEAVFWVAAAAAYAPVSQWWPFQHAVADRYLYFVLPGLIGAGALWLQAGGQALAARRHGSLRRVQWVGAALALGLAAGFALQAAQRAALWRNETLLLLDAARHDPDGISAHYLRACSAAQAGDAPQAAAELHAAATRGLDRFASVRDDPALAPIREEPAFREVIREMAGRYIAVARRRGYDTQPELRMLGLAHLEREELDAAVRAFEASLAAGGPWDVVVRAELASARARRAARRPSDRARAMRAAPNAVDVSAARS
jgi:protein O-mannosyl-transferase